MRMIMWGQPPVACPERSRRGCPPGEARLGVFRWQRYTGDAVFLGGLKNGSAVTFTFVFNRIASIVISICNCVPSFECSVSTLASASIFFKIGDQLVVVALPTCFSPEYKGTATREAWLGAAGVRP